MTEHRVNKMKPGNNVHATQEDVEQKIATVSTVIKFLSPNELDMVTEFIKHLVKTRGNTHERLTKKINKRKLNL